MKLYIKEAVFTLSDRFTVCDEHGNEVYLVEGEIFTFGKKLHVYDLSGREMVYIRQQVLSFPPCYDVYVNDTLVAQVEKEFTLLCHCFHVKGPGWDVEGEFLSHEYSITCDGSPIASISKEWMTWGDSYELDIADPADALTALAVVLVIDCILESGKK